MRVSMYLQNIFVQITIKHTLISLKLLIIYNVFVWIVGFVLMVDEYSTVS